MLCRNPQWMRAKLVIPMTMHCSGLYLQYRLDIYTWTCCSSNFWFTWFNRLYLGGHPTSASNITKENAEAIDRKSRNLSAVVCLIGKMIGHFVLSGYLTSYCGCPDEDQEEMSALCVGTFIGSETTPRPCNCKLTLRYTSSAIGNSWTVQEWN